MEHHHSPPQIPPNITVNHGVPQMHHHNYTTSRTSQSGSNTMGDNYQSMPNRSVEQSSSEILTPRSAQKYRDANRTFEQLLISADVTKPTIHHIPQQSHTRSNQNTLNIPQQHQTSRNYPDSHGQMNISRYQGNNDISPEPILPRKRPRIDKKKLTITVPQYTDKEERAPVPVQPVPSRNVEQSIPTLPENIDYDSFEFFSEDFPSLSNTLPFDSELPTGLTPIPLTPSSSKVPIYPWNPRPKTPVDTQFLDFGIEPPSKMRKLHDFR